MGKGIKGKKKKSGSQSRMKEARGTKLSRRRRQVKKKECFAHSLYNIKTPFEVVPKKKKRSTDQIGPGQQEGFFVTENKYLVWPLYTGHEHEAIPRGKGSPAGTRQTGTSERRFRFRSAGPQIFTGPRRLCHALPSAVGPTVEGLEVC